MFICLGLPQSGLPNPPVSFPCWRGVPAGSLGADGQQPRGSAPIGGHEAANMTWGFRSQVAGTVGICFFMKVLYLEIPYFLFWNSTVCRHLQTHQKIDWLIFGASAMFFSRLADAGEFKLHI